MSFLKKVTGYKGLISCVVRFTALLLVVCLLMPLVSPVTASASIPTRRTLRIGLNYNTTALPSANLQNDVGSGFEFGYYDANLNFTRVATTTETRITMMIDHNMVWNPGGAFSGAYYSVVTAAPPSGSTTVGYLHWQINSGRSTLAQAQADIAGIPGGFIRYNANSGDGVYIPMYGNYTSSANANAAKRSSAHTSNSGTGNTITVARTGTNVVLFEFDNTGNTSKLFGVRPLGGSGLSTHFRGYRYYGGFRYERRVNSAMTVVNIVNLEDYVKGVIPYEMSPSWPLEALKAQALCARTYAISMLNKHSSHGFDLCTEMDCQVYRGRGSASTTSDNAVNQTAGLFITYNGNLCETYYASSHGGGSENNENIWVGTARPYLRGVLDSYEEDINISGYSWTRTISQSTVTANVRKTYPSASTIVSMWVSQYTPTGNVLSVTVKDSNGKDYTFSRRGGLQSLLGVDAVRSQRFNIGSVTWKPGGSIYANVPAQQITTSQYNVISATEGGAVSTTTVSGSLTAIDGTGASGTMKTVIGGGAGTQSGSPTSPVGGNFTITGRGWGHSIGMSQWGAYSQAQVHKRTAEQIIKHYFTGVQITKG